MCLTKMAQIAGFTKAQPDSEDVTPLDVIFSCHICHATFSEVYEGHRETVQGLSDGINPKDRVVTRLFLANCCHVFCSKHLEGGGPPFHPAGSRPRAPCPMCTKDGELYSIRGFKPGEYDNAIPACWFVAPPIKLDANGKEMEALRFQYMSLITYAKQITRDHGRTKSELANAQIQLKEMQTLASEGQAIALNLEQEVERLRPLEAKLLKIKAQEPEVQYYLSLIPKFKEQNDQMRKRLASLGFQMPLEPLAYNKQLQRLNEMRNISEDDSNHITPVPAMSNITSSGSSNTLVNTGAPLSLSPQMRPMKRQRIESPRMDADTHTSSTQQRGLTSREQMPPPSGRAISRMKSMKKFWSPFRRKGPNGRSSPTCDNDLEYPSDMRMSNNEPHESEDRADELSNENHRPLTRHGYTTSGAPYMTGALEEGEQPYLSSTPQSNPLSHVGANGDSTEFTFRSSIQPPSQHPGLPSSKPSYIGLLDNLGCDTRLELGLTDPRQKTDGRYTQNYSNAPYASSTQGYCRNRQGGNPNRWSLGHAFLHQSSRRPTSVVYQHPDPLRSNQINGTNGRFTHASTTSPVTRMPTRFRQSTPLGESVVSPFFKSSNRGSQHFSTFGVTEPEDSLRHHSDVYQSQPRPVRPVQTSWREPRSLNGLSFFDSPLITDHGLSQRFLAGRNHPARNVDSRGFIIRPDTDHSPSHHDSTYGSLEGPTYSRIPRARSRAVIPFSSSSRFLHSRAAPFPSSMPSSLSTSRLATNSSNAHCDERSQLSIMNGRFGRQHSPRNRFKSPTKIPFPGAGRRRVRR